MHGAFRLGKQPVNGDGVRQHGLRRAQGADGPLDIRQVRVGVMMVMPVVVVVIVIVPVVVVMMPGKQRLVLLDPVHRDRNADAGHAAAHARSGGKGDARHAEGVEGGKRGGGIVRQRQQGGCEHIARGAHGQVEVERFHRPVPFVFRFTGPKNPCGS